MTQKLISEIPPPEHVPVAIRAYVEFEHPKDRDNWRGGINPPRNKTPSDWTVIFDCETTIDRLQRLRIGGYRVYRGDELWERGLFFEINAFTTTDIRVIRAFANKNEIELRSKEDFVENILFKYGYDFRGTIAGLNLPFDLSRLAIGHDTARSANMQKGFSFLMSRNGFRPRIQIKFRSQRSSFIQFAAPHRDFKGRSERRNKRRRPIRRGYFVDLKTIAAALTSQSHSLESLGEYLRVKHPKLKTAEHGKAITDKYLTYAMRDAETTSECFFALRDRYRAQDLTKTELHEIFSEAGLGKADLKEMNILPWRESQKDFPKELIGAIMASYYGGRSEVHLRRVVSQVLYCDFLSMYPTMCAWMKLWDFVIAEGVDCQDSTAETKRFLETVSLADHQRLDFGTQLCTIVQVEPNADVFPVRAAYEGKPQHTIALNYVTSTVPRWVTLSDCLVSRLRTGKAPKVIKAYSFTPRKPQSRLSPIAILGNPDYVVDPVKDDFYRKLIDLRTQIKQQAKAAQGAEKARLETDQFALKTLASATSYGIFIELNVRNLPKRQKMLRYDGGEKPAEILSAKYEEPGKYFHPLLATLITGAARLMLAIAETLILDAGLDWAFCDTDSMAIAKPENISNRIFEGKVRKICDWFLPLNPYTASKQPIFEIEDENYRLVAGHLTNELEPLFCYAISDKRYVLFNVDKGKRPILRRILSHGLGHLLAPYADGKAPREFPKPVIDLKKMGVKRWVHDFWYRIVVAALAEADTEINPADHPCFDNPAASRYHASNPMILGWIKDINPDGLYDERPRPFNFLMAFQAGFEASKRPGIDGMNGPYRPIAPFDNDVAKAAKHCVDRETGDRIPTSYLATYDEVLAQYHLHAETKFLNGRCLDRGATLRRHIEIDATDIHFIGKEADQFETQYFLGFDPNVQTDFGLAEGTRENLLGDAREIIGRYKILAVSKETGISTRYLRKIRNGSANVSVAMLRRIEASVPVLEERQQNQSILARKFVEWCRQQCEIQSIRELAGKLRTDHANLDKIIKGKRIPSFQIIGMMPHS